MKYNSESVYIGNIMELKDGNIKIKEEDVYLAYNEEMDTFYPVQSKGFVSYYELCLEREKLTEEEIKEREKEFINANYPYYDIPLKEGIYIDSNSIVEKINLNNKRR